MIVYYPTTPKQYLKIMKAGYIKGPIRVWSDPFFADVEGCRNSQSIILRLKFLDDMKNLEVVLDYSEYTGYTDSKLRILHDDYKLNDQLIPSKKTLEKFGMV